MSETESTEIRAFAETILFSPQLEAKLWSPDNVTDTAPGAPISIPTGPTRAQHLTIASGRLKKKVALPKGPALEDPRNRGVLLHLFANHELLALELMALMLLRFPDVAPAYRRCLVAIMGDEQRHLTLYLDAMSEMGIEMGAVPLNGFFWDNLAHAATPAAFAAGMSLTLEQANLDFAKHYADIFRSLNDPATADILEIIYEDEIGHVRQGVRWMTRWKAPGQSLWQAYCEHLEFPLTPARAKGIGFVEGARLKAGLDQHFIDQLKLYSHSKGRPPRVYLFNPGCEEEVLHGGSAHTLPLAIRTLTSDLETLPMLQAASDDVVLVDRQPAAAFLETLQALSFKIPQFVTIPMDAKRIPSDHPLTSRTLGPLTPWGHSPRMQRFLQPLDSRGELEAGDEAATHWPESRKEVYSKTWAVQKLQHFLAETAPRIPAGLLCGPADVGSVVRQFEDMQDALIAHSSSGPILLKGPYGSSGRHQLRLDDATLDEREAAWAKGIITRHGAIVVEPWRERHLDLSALFHVQADGTILFRGISRFVVDAQGRYRGAVLSIRGTGLEPEVLKFIYDGGNAPRRLDDVMAEAAQLVGSELYSRGHRGDAGIDAFIYREPTSGELRLKPIVEVNPRTTMGHLALQLQHHIGRGSFALWLFISRKEGTRAGYDTFLSLMDALTRALPRETRPAPALHLTQGAVATTDPECAETLLTVLVVHKSMKQLRSAITGVGLDWPLDGGQ